MGMFTSVYVPHPDRRGKELDTENGHHWLEIQFKTGDDNCDRYHIGDEVDWWVDENHVGRSCLLDGVYEGCSVNARDPKTQRPTSYGDWWVCVKDHEIAEVVPWDRTSDWGGEEERMPWHVQRDLLHTKWMIPKEPPRELWTEAAWEQYDEAQAIADEKAARNAEAGIDPINAWTREKMMQPGFLRQIMPDYSEPEVLVRPDGVMLDKGKTYDHFGRPVVLKRIYDNGNVGVEHLKGTFCLVRPEELMETEAVA